MTGTAKAHDTEVKILESKLQSLSERIIGLSEAGTAAINTSDQYMTFECRLESNEKDLDNFDEVWDRLRAVTITAGKSFPDTKLKDLYDSVHNEVMSGKAIYKMIQRQIRNQGPLPIQPVDANATFANQSSAKAHLPKIPIPQFSGDPTKWSHFKDIYLSLVHNEGALSNMEKYHYLLGALRGDALSLVSGLPIEDGSYMQAWEKLSKTYGNTRVLGSLLLQKIIDCDVRHAKNEAQRFEIFLTGVADNIQAFRALDLEDPKEFILSCLALRALDSDTRKQFELTMKPDAPHPKSEDVIGFVRQRKLALKMSQQICMGNPGSLHNATSANRQKYPNSRSPRYNGVALHSFTDYPVSHSGPQSPHAGSAGTSGRESDRHKQHAYRCQQCSGNHRLSRCDIFLRLDSTKRFEAVKGWKTCWNCLTPGHTVKTCKSRFTCRKCKGKHHTLLHTEPKGQVSAPGKGQDVQSKRDKPTQSQPNSAFTGFGSSTDCSTIPSTVLLGTVRALVKGDRGDLHSVRAVLDSGSQQSFITYSLARKMGAIVSPFEGRIASLAEAAIPQSHLKGVTSCCIQPCDGSQQLKAHPVVVDRITSALPTRDLSPRIMDSLKHHPLADFEFSESGPIELLIGGDLYPRIITGGPSSAGIDDLHLTPSIFGLVVTGNLTGEPDPNTFTLFTESHMNIEEQLKAFWDMEEPTPVDRTHPEDALCEEHFCRTHSRTTEGRYVVRLPIKGELGGVGFNRDHVLKRYLTLEQKLKRNSTLLQKYSEFMQEYKDLQHMSRASGSSPYLIPHHGVWQESSIGPKLRVVFDASCPSSSSSLNEILMAGPKMQKDLCEILIRFRLYPIPICADLVKMYRQILVHKDDRHLQHILWRNNPADSLEEFELNTVTYGIKSSAFQALRVVKQLVEDEGERFPLAAERVSTDMYVDDIVSGAHTVREALQLKEELCGLFAKGGFSLGKWASTLTQLLPSPEEPAHSVLLLPTGDGTIKILGLTWNASSDALSYSIMQPPSEKVTKRKMLSCVARAFDPLGLLAPVIFKAKSLIQAVWKSGIGWDDELPEELSTEWTNLVSEWSILSTISVPRFISVERPSFRIVGFCDASTKGYSAALYLRAEDAYGAVKVSLIKAKTKVAPLKFVSISRLELCGALLLSRLVSSAPTHLAKDSICFTDSRVTLAWINTPAHELKVFEANRVSQIVSIVPTRFWCHVRSEENPADLASRGCNPHAFTKDPLWWNGPDWLTSPISNWFQANDVSVVLANTISSCSPPELYDWTTKFSSYISLVRTVAKILRWRLSNPSCVRVKFSDPISSEDFAEAENRVFAFVQRLEFPPALFSSQCPPSYASLSSFLDEHGILRVGGRLQNSSLNFSAKHPVLLPPKSRLARLIVEHIHRSNFHAGPSLTLSLLRNKYWIPRAPRLIRSCITQCVHCRLSKAKPICPLMASLPKERFNELRAFIQTGVDYAGPFLIKESTRRNAKISKAYLCLFVCLSSKALHLELVSSLSTSSFLATLERFMARRGAPSTIWSDHGTNFIGASRFIKDLYKFHQEIEADIIERLSPRGVEWKHIPPRAPHFGGIWEAGVKSVKGLLVNSIGKQASTFEELTTALCKIEALLNSRPLCQLTEDADNFDFLTPGHFLIGASPSSLPGPSTKYFKDIPPSSRWEITQAQIAHVWERWRKEYLHSLQQRKKWTHSVPGIQVGDLVILLERRSTVGVWPVGRVTKVFPGRDGVTRVVELRTPSGKTLTRAVSSVVPLFQPESPETPKKDSG